MDVAGALEEVRDRVRRAGGDPDGLTIVAVTKGFGPEAVVAARAAGLDDIGENYAQEMTDKWSPGGRWHFLGAIQRNKVAQLAEKVDVWQAVDRPEEGVAIARHAPGAAVFVQINASGEAQKAGCSWDQAPPLVDALRGMALDVRGLMAVGPAGDAEAARQPFRRVAALAASLELREVSMGMTGDLE